MEYLIAGIVTVRQQMLEKISGLTRSFIINVKRPYSKIIKITNEIKNIKTNQKYFIF